jgi:hypothetical protein
MEKASKSTLHAALDGMKKLEASEIAVEVQQSLLEFVKGQARRLEIGRMIDELAEDTEDFFTRVEEEGIPQDELQILDGIEFTPRDQNLRQAMIHTSETERVKTRKTYERRMASGTARKSLFTKLAADYCEAAGSQLLSLDALMAAQERAITLQLAEGKNTMHLSAKTLNQFTDWEWLTSLDLSLSQKQLKSAEVEVQVQDS